jgi:NADH-quinone oxidoreductase subunit J
MGRLDPGAAAFAALALLTLGSAAVVALARNLIHSCVALAGALAGVAGLYVLLAADFAAAVQLLVYAGGTVALFLIAAMVTTRMDHVSTSNLPGARRAAGFATGLLLIGLASISLRTVWPTQDLAPVPSTAKLGHALLGDYALPFELAALVFLAGVIGAVTIARRAVRP